MNSKDYTILLIEDDPMLSKSIELTLSLEGFKVLTATSLKSAEKINESSKLDLVILDLNLPDGNGFSFLKKVRQAGSRLPIIILTSQTEEDFVVEGLQLGANDYVRKPFGNKELVARIKAILKVPFFRESQLRWAGILLLLDQRQVKYENQVIDLNARQFDILKLLIERAETVLTRQSILEKMDKDGEIFDRTIDAHISLLRTQLKKSGLHHIKISSVYGVGYRLETLP